MNENLVSLAGMIAIPFSAALGFCAILLGLFSFDDTRKIQISSTIQNIFMKKNKATQFSQWWAKYFFIMFGEKHLSKRQLITIPFCTILYSSLLFVFWYLWALLFRNPEHIIPKQIPMNISVELNDFIHYGFVYSLVLDFISVWLTRMYIKHSLKNTFTSTKAVVYFVLSILLILLLFTIIIHHLKVNSIEDLYIGQQLYFEQRPEIVWNPVSILCSSLSIEHNETMLIFTPKGLLSNYYIPQGIMLYASFITQFSMIIIFCCYALVKLLSKIERVSLSLLENAGTPRMSAWGFVMLAVLIILAVPVCALVLLSFHST